MAVSIPFPLSARDASQVMHLGRQLADQGVTRPVVQGGLLTSMLVDGEAQTAAGQQDNRQGADSGMTTTEFDAYLKFMGPRLEGASSVVQHDPENPHKEEIAEGMLRTAAFVRGLQEQQARENELKEAMQQEIVRQQMEAYRDAQERQAEQQQKESGLSLGSTIGGIFDEMVKVLSGGPEGDSRALRADMQKVVQGLHDCQDVSANKTLASRDTPAAARPARETSLHI